MKAQMFFIRRFLFAQLQSCTSLFSDRQEQCNVLVELLREYQILKTSISSIIESTEPLVDISSVLKDHEETRRSLTKVRSNHDLSSGFLFCLCDRSSEF